MRNRTLGTLGTAGLLLLSLALAGCGSSGQSGTKASSTTKASAGSGGQACQAVPGDQLVALTDDKKLQTVDNIIPAVNAKAASQPLLDALNKVQATLTSADLIALNKSTDIDRKTSPNVAKDYVTTKGLATGVSGGSGNITIGAANRARRETRNVITRVLRLFFFAAS